MIRKVKHQNIDRKKYQNCIINAINYRVYAEDWYLDNHTNQQWDCLVCDDYEAVMPLPIISKFGINFISQPIFCQQLGVFYTENFDITILNDFSKIFEKQKVISYQFNEENISLNLLNTKIKKNHLLNLNSSYDDIFSKYRKDRKKDIRRIEKLEVSIIREFKKEILIQELKERYPYFIQYYEKPWFENLLSEIVKQKCYSYYELRVHTELVSTAFFVHSKNRSIILLSTRSNKPEYKGSFAYLLDYFIKNNSGKDLILDFEGSMVPNIADFNESFGAVAVDYYSIQNSKQDIIKSFIKP